MVYEGLIAKFSQNEELKKAIKEHPEADKEEIYKNVKNRKNKNMRIFQQIKKFIIRKILDK